MLHTEPGKTAIIQCTYRRILADDVLSTLSSFYAVFKHKLIPKNRCDSCIAIRTASIEC